MGTELASSYLTALPTTKQQVESFAVAIKNEIMSGAISPAVAFVQLKAMEDFAKKLRADEEIKDVLFQMLDHSNKIEIYGAVISTKNVSEYDYCQDSTLAELEKEKERINDKIKNRKSLLEKLEEPIIVEETGEVIQPAKYVGSKPQIVVSLKK